jgi:hypothetical protein
MASPSPVDQWAAVIPDETLNSLSPLADWT